MTTARTRFCRAILPGALCALGLCARPLLAQEPEKSLPQPKIEEVSPGVYKIGALRLEKAARRVIFPAVINMTDGSLEYLLVTKQGSAHESLLLSALQPGDLHFAMLLIGAKGAGLTTPAPKDAAPPQIDAEYLKNAPQLKGDSLTITARWTKNGKEQNSRVEDWILNDKTKKPMERGPWIYTGSLFVEDQFLAQVEGCFAALVINPAALINNPRKDNDNDTAWVVNKKAVPPRDTALELIIQLEPADAAPAPR